MLEVHRKPLQSFLITYLSQQQKRYTNVNGWSKDSLTRLSQFATSGKLLRGSFVLFIAQAVGKKDLKDVLPVAAAIELTHSSLLIHDDIIDRDALRRGLTTMHEQYTKVSPSPRQANHYGISQAICVGDLGFFFTFDLLSHNEAATKIIPLVSQDISKTIFAQMEDIHFAMSASMPTQQAIEKMYLYKTARYTFSLPFIAGAQMGNASPALQKELASLGETLGLLFQLKDDELGLFGDPAKTGKPVGSDIREAKKTLHMHQLLAKSSTAEKRTIARIVGNQHSSPQEILTIQNLIKSKKIDQLLQERMQLLAKQSIAKIGKLPFSEDNKVQLMQLTHYLLKRDS